MVGRSSPTFKTHARAILVEHFAERNRSFLRKYSSRRNLISLIFRKLDCKLIFWQWRIFNMLLRWRMIWAWAQQKVDPIKADAGLETFHTKRASNLKTFKLLFFLFEEWFRLHQLEGVKSSFFLIKKQHIEDPSLPED